MKISFGGNHIFKFPDREITITAYENYMEKRKKNGEDAIIYANDYYVHVIDGQDAQNFRRAEKLNNDVIKQPFLFEELTDSYRKSAKVVDFSNLLDSEINV